MMDMRVHEIHPAVVHAPLALLPAAALADAMALGRDPWGPLAKFGRRLWAAGAIAGLFAGAAGMAASQEVNAEKPQTKDTMLIHGLLNLVLVGGAIGIALWRRANGPSAAISALGLAASSAAVYSAYLGGELVYADGVGVRATRGEEFSPPVLSPEAPSRFAQDAARGLSWLLRSGADLLRGERRLTPGALRLQAIQAQPRLS